LAIGALALVLVVTLEALLFKLLLLTLECCCGYKLLFLLVANLTKDTPSSTNVSGKVNCCFDRSSLTTVDEEVDDEQLDELFCLLLLIFVPMKPLLLLLLLLLLPFVHACIGVLIASSLL
jgi:hypothetical protein